MEALAPEVVGRYAIDGKIASGGMASVHFGRLIGGAGFSGTVASSTRTSPRTPTSCRPSSTRRGSPPASTTPYVVATLQVQKKRESTLRQLDLAKHAEELTPPTTRSSTTRSPERGIALRPGRYKAPSL
jgi:hypothetical protein